MKFSERMGFVSVSDVLQREGISDQLRNGFWNYLDEKLWSQESFSYSNRGDGKVGDIVSRLIWTDFFKVPADLRASGVRFTYPTKTVVGKTRCQIALSMKAPLLEEKLKSDYSQMMGFLADGILLF